MTLLWQSTPVVANKAAAWLLLQDARLSQVEVPLRIIEWHSWQRSHGTAPGNVPVSHKERSLLQVTTGTGTQARSPTDMVYQTTLQGLPFKVKAVGGPLVPFQVPLKPGSDETD